MSSGGGTELKIATTIELTTHAFTLCCSALNGMTDNQPSMKTTATAEQHWLQQQLPAGSTGSRYSYISSIVRARKRSLQYSGAKP